MSDRVPGDEQRDHYLDELMSAYASGQIDSAEFSIRSDQVMNGSTAADLEAALTGLSLHDNTARKNGIPDFPPPGEEFPGPDSGGHEAARRSRRQAIVLGGSVAFTLVGGVGTFLAASSSSRKVEQSLPTSGATYSPPEAYPVPNGFLSLDNYPGYYKYTTGLIASAVITNDLVKLHVQPEGEAWQLVTITKEARVEISSAESTTNFFRSPEAEISVLVEVVDISTRSLGQSVVSVEFFRPDPAAHVQMHAVADSGAKVIWDAYTRVILYANNPRTSGESTPAATTSAGATPPSAEASPTSVSPSASPTG